MVQPILDIFPETVALGNIDRIQVPFLTNSDGVLLVPMSVAYCHQEMLFIITAAEFIPPPTPPREASPEPIYMPTPPMKKWDPTSELAKISRRNNNPFDFFSDLTAKESSSDSIPDNNPYRHYMSSIEESRSTNTLSNNNTTERDFVRRASPPQNQSSNLFTQPSDNITQMQERRSVTRSNGNNYNQSIQSNYASDELTTMELSDLLESMTTTENLNHASDTFSSSFAQNEDLEALSSVFGGNSTSHESGLTNLPNTVLSPMSKLGVQLISQDVPLAEQLIPRLFVVLPDPKPRSISDEANADSRTRVFRLYFLCDCGDGATLPLENGSGATGSSHQSREMAHNNCIHIADQPGYEINNFTQFSKQFGLYTLLILQLFQKGVETTTLRGHTEHTKTFIPPLTQSQYSNILQPFTWEIKERVTTAIKAFQDDFPGLELEQMDTPPVIDVRRLWECVDGLQVGGECHAEGMRRMIVYDGTYRWICAEHYNSSFEYAHKDSLALIKNCKAVVGDDTPNDIPDQVSVSSDDETTFLASGRSVSFDDGKKHLKLFNMFTVDKIKSLATVLNSNETTQQVTLACPLSSVELVSAITEMISNSRVELWNLIFLSEQAIAANKLNSTITIEPSAGAPPSYSQMHQSQPTRTREFSTESQYRQQRATNWRQEYSNGNLHPIYHLLFLEKVQSLQIPDLNRNLFEGANPNLGEVASLRKLHIWGSDATGEKAGFGNSYEPVGKWGISGLGTLVKAFNNLTELHITGLHLAKSMDSPQNPRRNSHQVITEGSKLQSLIEITQCLRHLSKLSVLNLSSCGLLKEHCQILAECLSKLDNRITHLDIHDNWIEDDGLSELLWATGKHLYSLDARNTGFGNASALALSSILQNHGSSAAEDQEFGRLVIYKILKLEETYNPHLRLWPSNSNPSLKLRASDLNETGRNNLIKALELLEPKELCLRFDLAFGDADFASAFSGMRKLECLEKLEVSFSNFGPQALAAMLRILRATSCRLREFEIHSTLLSEREQQDALDEILNI
ncbi:hypothetical protein BGZ76_006669 [Entomortierella beljakovae]|nr:hypothetical protein BGZ76_006669 [Entomortierella beljakovae]